MNSTLRFTNLTILGNNTGNSFFVPGESHETNQGSVGHLGIDEVVASPGGVFASLQDPPNLAQLLNSNEGACSFVM